MMSRDLAESIPHTSQVDRLVHTQQGGKPHCRSQVRLSGQSVSFMHRRHRCCVCRLSVYNVVLARSHRRFDSEPLAPNATPIETGVKVAMIV